MPLIADETEFTDVHMIQKVVGMFESRQFQRIVTCGLLGIEYDEDLDVDDYNWPHQHNGFYGYQGNDRGLNGRSSASVYQPLNYPSTRDSPRLPFVHPKESDSERKARLLQEAKKSKEKTEKKRLKKQKQKQRKQMEKEKHKGGNIAEDGKLVDDPKQDYPDSGVKNLAAAKDADSDSKSSEYESSEEEDDAKSNTGDVEELDMSSCFVSNAALIMKRKTEQKHKLDKKKSPEKKSRNVPDKEEAAGKEAQKKDSAASLTFEDNVKISTDLAIMGNKFASAGDYNMAVKYFTDAIKYNPKEFKLFGNRSFCFEKLQEYEKALADAELSVGISPGWVKGTFRKGRALAGLKRYEEAAEAFKDVLKRDSSYAEAAQELMRVQIIQLMAYGFTREQSSNALIIHGTVKKALEVLSKLNHPPGAVLNSALPPAQVVNITGVSPGLSARAQPSPAAAPLHKAVEKLRLNKPVGPTPNISSVNHSQIRKTKNDYNQPAPELFPIWVGNLTFPPTESTITDLFSEAGHVYSVKILSYKRCAFVNFTEQRHCDEAIRRFHGSLLNGVRIAVRYPDRIPAGMGISKTALRSHNQEI